MTCYLKRSIQVQSLQDQFSSNFIITISCHLNVWTRFTSLLTATIINNIGVYKINLHDKVLPQDTSY